MKCYELRLSEAAGQAVAGGFDYFTTTLSISPMKNAQKLNEIGLRVGEEYGVKYLGLILRRKTDISDPSNCRKNTDYTGRTTADASFPLRRD